MTERYKKIGTAILIALLTAGAFYVVFKFVLPLFLPFIVAWIIAALLQPLIRFLGDKIKIPKKISVLILVLAAVSLIAGILYAIINRIALEITSLAGILQQWMQNIANNDSAVDNIIGWLNKAIPFVDFSDILYDIWDNFDGYLLDAIKAVSGNITGLIPLLKEVVIMIPNALIFIVITIISCFYIACDFDKINKFITFQFPIRVRTFGTVVKTQFILTIGKYIKAYALIVIITFTELFIGFSILGIDYSFILALATALIDIMPILGTGLILLPWAIYSLITRNYFLGIGLLILYAVVAVVRQIIEPRIIGSYIGLYPLATLMAMYVGTRVMGVFGLFFFPITIILLKKLNDEGHIKLLKKTEDEFDEQTKKQKLISRVEKRLKKNKNKKKNKKAAEEAEKKETENGSK